jgi:hypothetical protein
MLAKITCNQQWLDKRRRFARSEMRPFHRTDFQRLISPSVGQSYWPRTGVPS